jgi:structural maintenance of chromosome 2
MNVEKNSKKSQRAENSEQEKEGTETAAMYIQELIIDGFKSYATRTVISGFDSQFNAITGLNGSGKSNILDAICFVLGISNLSQVRNHNSLTPLSLISSLSLSPNRSVLVIFKN